MATRAPALTVVGDINVDLVLRTARLPLAGETLTGATLAEVPGGKGANQALAAARLGAETAFIGRVGRDAQAELALAELRAAGVELGTVVTDSDAPTGLAVVTVAESGENQIVVASGANATIGANDVRATGGPRSGGQRGVLCQLGIPNEAIRAASELDCALFCINAAPARSLPAEIWARAGLVIVTEIERDQLAGELAGLEGLLATTLGAQGATLEQGGRTRARATPPHVDVVDTTGAGDAFSAALVVGLLEARPEQEALERACVAGALATTRHGAQAGLPTSAEIDKLRG